ncbi:MAG: hypothetical protein P4L59_13445 [Desulfosporosinus sp.]|nr:hypothetical protein [Desulfosporosinus sp.]
MKKNHKILVSIGIVLLLTVTTPGIFFPVKKVINLKVLPKEAMSYSTAINFIKTEQLSEETEILDNLHGFRNSNSEATENIAKLYAEAISYSTAISFIKAGQLSEATKILDNLNGFSNSNSNATEKLAKLNAYKSSNILVEYIDVLRESKLGLPPDLILDYYFNIIPENYNGDLSKEINEYRTQLEQARLKADAYAKSIGYANASAEARANPMANEKALGYRIDLERESTDIPTTLANVGNKIAEIYTTWGGYLDLYMKENPDNTHYNPRQDISKEHKVRVVKMEYPNGLESRYGFFNYALIITVYDARTSELLTSAGQWAHSKPLAK